MAVTQKEQTWSIEAIIDELFLCLITTRDHNRTIYRKYEQQAKRLIYRIPIYRPPPFFVIKVEDLTPEIKQELASLEGKLLDLVVKEAVSKIFEQIDERYFLLSVKPLLNWKME